jgi:4a-hydroxytetrahydrobiopterin dehydratase
LKDWKLLGFKKIRKEFVFKDFKEAMKFVEKIGFLAEKEGHHPDIFISYNRVILDLYTHSVSGLTENDFILASKINEINLNEEK